MRIKLFFFEKILSEREFIASIIYTLSFMKIFNGCHFLTVFLEKIAVKANSMPFHARTLNALGTTSCCILAKYQLQFFKNPDNLEALHHHDRITWRHRTTMTG